MADRKTFVRPESILAALRARIVRGSLRPGARLPTRRELCRVSKASLVTVQRALEALEEEGFIASNGRHGTFVAEFPPHLWEYALCFPHHPAKTKDWVRYWTALSHEASRLAETTRRRFMCFYNLEDPLKADDYPRLERLIANRRLAGVIFPSSPFRFEGTPIVATSGVPLVAVHHRRECGVPAVSLDGQALIEKALRHFVARRRRRLAAILVPGHAREFSADIQRVAARIGLEHRACWLQVVAQTAAEWARNTVQLLLAGPPRERPDALLIADDNLVEHATAGVIAAGLRAPEDVEIVAHCNFPWPAPSVLPARRLGYDTGELLFVCLGLLERQRRGEAVPDCTRLAPRFEDELRTASEHTPRV